MEMLRKRAGSNVAISECGSQRSINVPPPPSVTFAQPRLSGQSGIELRPLIDGSRGRKVHPADDRDQDSGKSVPDMGDEEEAELEQLAISAVMTADELDCKDEG